MCISIKALSVLYFIDLERECQDRGEVCCLDLLEALHVTLCDSAHDTVLGFHFVIVYLAFGR